MITKNFPNTMEGNIHRQLAHSIYQKGQTYKPKETVPKYTVVKLKDQDKEQQETTNRMDGRLPNINNERQKIVENQLPLEGEGREKSGELQ